MAIAETLKILPRDLSGAIYAGKPLRKSDILSIDPGIKRICFRMPVDVKAISASSLTDIVFLQSSRVVHLMIAGRLISLGNLFCGSLECGGDILVKGDLVTWLGDVETLSGNICVTGDLTSAARIKAKTGVVIVNGEAEAEAHPETQLFWEGIHGVPLPETARKVAIEAGHLLKSVSQR